MKAKQRFRRKFVKASNYWLPAMLARQMCGQRVLNRDHSFWLGFFESGMKIKPTQNESAYLIERLEMLLHFVCALEKGNVQGAVKTASEQLGRDLTSEEVSLLVKNFPGKVTVVLSQNDGVSIKLEG